MESELLIERPPLARARAMPAERRVSAALLLAGALAAAWLLLAPRTPDLAAQVYRSRLFEASGLAVWDDNWYGGHHLPGYSLLFGWVALLLGLRLAGALAVLASTWAFERVVIAVYGPRARWGAACFALAAAGDLWIGRLTFALGVTFAVLAVLALVRGRPLLAGALAGACAAASPVAGLLLALAGATDVVANRRLRPGIALIAPVMALLAALAGLFPEGGFEPYGARALAASTAVALAFVWALPRRERLLRTGGWLFVVVNLLSLVPTPMGSNVVRYAVLLAGPLLLCALARDGGVGRARDRPPAALALALAGMAVWIVWGPIVQTAQVLHDPSTSASFYVPVRRFLAAHAKGPVRVEVPFTRSHWEAALLAPYVPLARGWERQLDKRYDRAIEASPLAPATYRRWLLRNAVGYVALADVPVDGSSVGEAALVRRGVPYLREVLHTAHWRVFRVLDPTPLASAPATLTALGHDSLTLRFAAAGTSVVRVHYTRYWTPETSAACVRPAAEGWTAVSAARPGVVRVAARFSPARALGLSGACAAR